jgi:hypothetical protein
MPRPLDGFLGLIIILSNLTFFKQKIFLKNFLNLTCFKLLSFIKCFKLDLLN